jgi:amino acid adenylation domain-containing protein
VKRKILDLGSTSEVPRVEIREVEIHDIAVIGMAVRLAGYEDLYSFWNDLAHGVDRVGAISRARRKDADDLLRLSGIDPTMASYTEMAFLDRIDLFDPGFFRLSPRDAELLDPDQRLFLETAWHALEEAGYGGERLRGARVGVYVGAGANRRYAEVAANVAEDHWAQIFAGNVPAHLAARVSYLNDWHGPAMMVDTACSSSLIALHLAIRALRGRECDLCLVGSVKTVLAPVASEQRTEIESPDGRTRSFDDAAEGTGGGEGVLAVLLKPLQQALRDGDQVHAVLRGSAANQDGATAGITVPNADAQADVIERAWRDAGVDPCSIGLIEAHGTATRLGDEIEIAGLTKAFSRFTERRQICAIGSVKSNYGHLDCAAGLLGLIKTVLCLRHRQVAPLVHLRRPNRRIPFVESPVYLADRLREWPAGREPRRCGVSSFGLSGTNCHVVVEEAPSPEEALIEEETACLLVLSGRNHAALQRQVEAFLTFLDRAEPVNLADVCFTAAVGRGHYSHRLALLVHDLQELRQKLQLLVDQDLQPATGSGLLVGQHALVTGSHGAGIEGALTKREQEQLSRQAAAALSAVGQGGPDLLKVAELYVGGATVDWAWLYEGQRRRVVSIPTYPFARQRCWVPVADRLSSRGEVDRTARPSRFDDRQGTFLAHLLVETPEQTVYSLALDPGRWWLLDQHRVLGRPTLVGSAYLQLVCEAARHQGLGGLLQIRDLLLKQPLIVPEQGVEVLVLVGHGGDQCTITVSGRSDRGWIEYAAAWVGQGRGTAGTMDIETIRQRCRLTEIARQQAPGPVQAGPRWQCLEQLWVGEEELLARLRLAEPFTDDLDDYFIHPPLLDVAYSLGLEPGFLPMACSEARIYAPLPAEVLSHVRRRPGAPAAVQEVDVVLAAADGAICIEIDGLVFRQIGQELSEQTLPLFSLRWVDEPPPPSPPGDRGRVAVLGGPAELRLEVEQALTSAGSSVVSLSQQETDEEAQQRLVTELAGNQVDCLVLLHGLDLAKKCRSLDDLVQRIRSSAHPLARLVKGLVAVSVTHPLDILLVGQSINPVTGDEPWLRPELALLTGIGKVVGLEYPNLRCRLVDLDGEAETARVAGWLVEELTWAFTGPLFQVARRGDRRLVEELYRLTPDEEAQSPVREGGVYLVTGGLSGIGLEVAAWLGSRANVKLALLARTPLPERGRWPDLLAEGDAKNCRAIRVLTSLEEAGHEVLVLTADVSRPRRLQAALDQVRQRLGRINGIVHAAGIAGEGFLFNKPLAELDRVLRPKVHGTWLLDQLTRDDPPELMVTCSAHTALAGAPGQGDYAAANAYLDAFCLHRTRQGRPTLSLSWPAWQETGMAFERQHQTGGFAPHSISTAAGLHALGQAMAGPSGLVIVGGPPAANQALLEAAPYRLAPDLAATVAAGSRPDANDHRPDQDLELSGRRDGDYSRLERDIAGIWADNLGYESISIHDSFFDLGGDSINAMQIRNSIAELMAVEVSIADIFTYTSIAELAAFVAGRQAEDGAGAVAQAIEPVPPQPSYPVSSSQRRLYFFWQLARETTGYNLPFVLLIDGKPDVAGLRSAFQSLVARHEVLRTCFVLDNDEPVQVVNADVDFQVRQVFLATGDLERYIRSFVRAFDLSRAPLLRAELVALDDGRHALLLDIHHIVADAMSLQIIAHELSALLAGEELAAPDLQYRDYAVWQRRLLTGGALAEQRRYWLDQFADGVPVLTLPLDAPRPALQTYEGDLISFEVSAELLDRVRRLAGEQRTTPFVVFLTAFFLLLHHSCGQDDLVIAVMESGRSRPELEGMIGMFVNNLAVRARPRSDQTVEDFLVAVRGLAEAAQRNRDYPFDELVEELDLPRDLSRNPLADVAFSYMSFEQAELSAGGDACFSKYGGKLKSSSKLDMTLFAQEHDRGVSGSFEYYSAVYPRLAMERFSARFVMTVEQIVADTGQRIGDIELLPASERRQVSGLGRAPERPAPETTLLPGLEEQAAIAADAVAVIHGSERWTYGELHCFANRLARHLQELGIGPEQMVGICMERTPQMVAGLIAILKAGGAYVPLDPAYPAERLALIMEDAQCSVVLTQESLLARLPEQGGGFKPDVVAVDRIQELIRKQDSSPPQCTVQPRNLAYLLYTSGSTGRPKGVAIEHRSAAALVAWARQTFSPQQLAGVLAGSSICFDLSVFELLVTLSSGGRLILADSLLELPSLTAADEVTLINTVPTAMAELVRSGTVPESVRTVNLAGEPVPMELVDRLYQLGSIDIVNELYGPCEDTTYSTGGQRAAGQPATIGRPVNGSRFFILGRNLQLLPLGVAGQLCLAGTGLARGYLGQPRRTAESFIPDPYSEEPGARLYLSGDRARFREDGTVEVIGRLDHQVKLRGFRIELGEIEVALGAHPQVREAAVTLREDASGEPQLVAYVVSDESDNGTTVAGLGQYLERRLPHYMVPAVIVGLDAMPRTPSGKLDRQALPLPREQLGEAAEPPSTATEKSLAAIWSEVLGVQEISADDSFFDIGGHSLKATRVINRVRRELGVELSMHELFRRPTLRELAAAVDQAPAEPVESIPHSEPRPASDEELAQLRRLLGQERPS